MSRGLFGSLVRSESKAVGFSGDWQDAFAPPSRTGVPVTISTALQCTVALACTMAIASGVAMLPLKLYRPRADGGREEARDVRLFEMMDLAPNDWQTSVEFIETLVMHAVLAGDGIAFINRIDGEPRELIPLLPEHVQVEQEGDYSLTYWVSFADGSSVRLGRHDVLHLRGPSWNAYGGLPGVRLAREAIGLALATEETHARLHGNGARPGGLLSTEGKLDQESINRIREQWQQVQGGVANAMKTAILQGGLKWTPLAMSGVDSEHIATRKFQIEEVCRAMGVFPQMVGHSDKAATYASAEAFFLAHVIHTLSRWTRRMEKRFAVDLMTSAQRREGLYFKFSFQSLLRGDNKTRAEFYRALVMLGVMTRNEARAFEELNPIDGLDEPLVPLNMATQAERDALGDDVAEAVKAALIGHNGGPGLDLDDVSADVARAVKAAVAARVASGAGR